MRRRPSQAANEFAIVEAPERAVTRLGKGKPMKALLLKKWGNNYAGQVLTHVEKGSMPSDVARFYEDDEPTPYDVVKDEPSPEENNPLVVLNDEMDPTQADAIAKDKKATVQRAKEAAGKQSQADAAVEQEREDTQRRAREAELLAAKRTKAGGKKGGGKKGGGKLSETQKKRGRAGKEHSVK